MHLQFLDDVFPQQAVGLFDLVNNIIVIGYMHVNLIEQGQTQRGGGGLLTPPYPPHPNANQTKISYPKPLKHSNKESQDKMRVRTFF